MSLRVKIFFWLTIQVSNDGTRLQIDRRRRHGLAAFLCNKEEETIDHISAECSFTREIWWHVLTALAALQGTASRSRRQLHVGMVEANSAVMERCPEAQC